MNFKKGAIKGYALAQYQVGVMYFRGEGIKQDYEKAFYWLDKASKQYHLDARFQVGLMYLNGIFVDKNVEGAFRLFKSLAEREEHAPAQNQLGKMYL